MATVLDIQRRLSSLGYNPEVLDGNKTAKDTGTAAQKPY